MKVGMEVKMVRAISEDLRMRVVEARAQGMTCRAVAEQFHVSLSSVVKWCQRHAQTGSVLLFGK